MKKKRTLLFALAVVATVSLSLLLKTKESKAACVCDIYYGGTEVCCITQPGTCNALNSTGLLGPFYVYPGLETE